MARTPFAPLSTLGFDSGRFFDDLFGGGVLSPAWGGGGLLGAPRLGAGVSGALRPLYCDVVERDKEYEMRVDVPGARPHASAAAARRAAAREGARAHLACSAPPAARPHDAPRRRGRNLNATVPSAAAPLAPRPLPRAQHLD